MTAPDDPRTRILAEVRMLQHQVQACDHCQACRAQAAALLNLLPEPSSSSFATLHGMTPEEAMRILNAVRP